jgi:hypothetical protein
MARNENGKHTDGSVKIWKEQAQEDSWLRSLALHLLYLLQRCINCFSFRTRLAANGAVEFCFSVSEKERFDLDYVLMM